MTKNKKEITPDQEVISNTEISTKEIVPLEKKVVKQNLNTWIANRQEFKEKIVSQMKVGLHFHDIKIGGKEVKSLSKGGAEMVASAFGWRAEFVKDSDTWEMLGSVPGMVCYICNLLNGEAVGQGRGARSTKQDGGDANKTIKMAQKSAFIDAVLRSSGLSDLFTQDLDDQPMQKTVQRTFDQTIAPTKKDNALPLIKALDLCVTKQEYESVCTEIKIAKENGHLDKDDYEKVLIVAKKVAEKIQRLLSPAERMKAKAQELRNQKEQSYGKI